MNRFVAKLRTTSQTVLLTGLIPQEFGFGWTELQRERKPSAEVDRLRRDHGQVQGALERFRHPAVLWRLLVYEECEVGHNGRFHPSVSTQQEQHKRRRLFWTIGGNALSLRQIKTSATTARSRYRLKSTISRCSNPGGQR